MSDLAELTARVEKLERDRFLLKMALLNAQSSAFVSMKAAIGALKGDISALEAALEELVDISERNDKLIEEIGIGGK